MIAGQNYARQKGAVLLISLIFLVLLTIIGVTAMQTTTLQERMAGNLRDLNLAFNAAEAALREGEAVLHKDTGTRTNRINTRLETAIPDLGGWQGLNGSAGSATIGNVESQPVYFLGPPELVRVGSGLPPIYRYMYPVTAHGKGGTAKAMVNIHTIYEGID